MSRRVVRALVPAEPTEELFMARMRTLPVSQQVLQLQLRQNLPAQLRERVEQRARRPLMEQPALVRRRVAGAPRLANFPVPVMEDDRPVNGFVSWELDFRISQTTDKKTGSFRYTGPASGLRQRVDEIIADYLNPVGETYEILDVRVGIRTLTGTDVPFSYTANRMLSQTPLNLSVNMFGNLIDIAPSDENCVKTFLRKHHPAISKMKKDPIGRLGTDDGVSTDELVEYCKTFNVRMIAYNIKKEVIATYIPEKNDKKYAGLYFISHNNHMYPVKNAYLSQIPKPTQSCLLPEDSLYERFEELLNAGVVPSDIRLHENSVSSFDHDGTHYYTNSQHSECFKVLQSFGLADKITPTTKYTNVLGILEHAYGTAPVDSFFPISHTKLPFWYNKDDIDPTREVDTIDKNKAYSSILKDLPNLLSVDYRTTPIESFPFKLTEHALYIATPEIPNILMPKQDIYCGAHLLYCKGKVNFTLQEKLVATPHPNSYTTIISDLYEMCDPNVVKQIVVRTIGTFQSETQVKSAVSAHVVNKREHNPDCDALPIGNFMLELDSSPYIHKVSNRKPIAIQIKDRMSVLLYEKMKELHLTTDEIVQINTDSITFYKHPTRRIVTQNTLDGWKTSTYTAKQGSLFDSVMPFTTMRRTIPNDNTLIQGPAGNGKTYHIQNKMDLTDSIILSSKHSAIATHRDKGLNAQVIQYYQFNRTIPTESHIIVEEMGILDRHQWDILFRCFMLGKKLTCLGDFQQLLPVSETATFSAPQFLDLMFAHQTHMNTNYRNAFTLDYYRTLMTSTDREFLTQELRRHSTQRPEDAEVIIAYRNVVVDTYNRHMLNNRGKTIDDPDVPMLCKDNELRDKNIFNGFVLNSQDIDPADKKHFKPAYARTLYNMQGDQVRSFYVAPEDISYFAKGREAYTLISRLRTT